MRPAVSSLHPKILRVRECVTPDRGSLGIYNGIHQQKDGTLRDRRRQPRNIYRNGLSELIPFNQTPNSLMLQSASVTIYSQVSTDGSGVSQREYVPIFETSVCNAEIKTRTVSTGVSSIVRSDVDKLLGFAAHSE